MAYSKDYYHILGLDAPGWRSTAAKQQQQHVNFTADLRRAYKAALLAAHPDKKKAATNTLAAPVAAAGGGGYTIDDIKQAYTTLSDPKSRAEYENWYLHHRHDEILLPPSSSSSLSSSAVEAREKAANADFVLGLEVLDLSEFDEAAQGNNEGEERMQWTRACRCGSEKGFLILEEELEDAESRGEKEVLVGCEGCSLWVRVGFDVEEE